jgi:hypothetical protein
MSFYYEETDFLKLMLITIKLDFIFARYYLIVKAGVTQLVESQPSKLLVASSNLVSRF